jgi:uncharacterized membrane protein
MKNQSQVITAAMVGVLSLGALASAASAAPLVFCAEQEKCYGVTKAGKNDCSTATSACAGTAKQDFQKDAWIHVPKGSCEKIAGGTLKPAVPTNKK